MWLTGFDVPFLDTIYIDKPVQRHNLIQTISRVNRKFENRCNVRQVPARIQFEKDFYSSIEAYIKWSQTQRRDI